MAKASKKNMGIGNQGKGDGSGAMTELPEGVLPDNMVLSNRDKAQHSEARGYDGRMIQTEQYHDHEANQRRFDDEGNPIADGLTEADADAIEGAPPSRASSPDSAPDHDDKG